MLLRIYERLPTRLQLIAKRAYDYSQSSEEVRDDFVETVFESRREYREYEREFDRTGVIETVEEAVRDFSASVTDERGTWAGIGHTPAKALYALVRKSEPSVIVETGVCNGVSSLIVLHALSQNEGGSLHSVDYPMYADEPLPEFRERAYPDNSAFSAIPADKEPGWVIPDNLKSRWELHIGKSQRVLPQVLADHDSIDLFVHDSEHTHPCMMFEYELAWEWLDAGGHLLVDDVNANDSFEIFTSVREPTRHGFITDDVGYASK